MNVNYDKIIRGGTLVSLVGEVKVDIAIDGERIAAIGNLGSSSGGEEIDATGLHIMPGVIDTQVHFREPGNEYKEDLASGSLAAVMGGVTAVFEMPNTNPTTSTVEAIEDKLNRAKGRMWCDHAFYVGATKDNAHDLPELERMPGTAGVKIFMGASTGDLLVDDDENLREVMKFGVRRVAVHCEDEPRMQERLGERVPGDPSSHPIWRDEETALRATKRIVTIAMEEARPIHVLHVTTAEEMEWLHKIKAEAGGLVSVETTPQHLSLSAPDCYERLGTLAQMNPPIRSARHMPGLWDAITNLTVDVLGSDHAPHTREEKAKPYPNSPSGMPGVQTLLPVMLDHVAHGRLSLERLVDLTSAGAARIFGLTDKGILREGGHADLTIVDLQKKWTVTEDWAKSKCGWSPFMGDTLTGKPVGTIIRGHRVMWEDELIGSAAGEPIRFDSTCD